MDAKQQVIQANIPFRIRLGVTGPRTVTDPGPLSERIRTVLQTRIFDLFDEDSKKLIRASPHTPIAFSLLTSLAEGVDRLVAREVLQAPDSRLEVVLPVAKEEYLHSLPSPESRAEFEELFGRARRPIALKVRTFAEESPQGDREEARRQACLEASQYIVDHCDVLIALEEGTPPSSRARSGETLAYARAQQRPVILLSTAPPYDISIETGHGLSARSIRGIELFNAFAFSAEEEAKYIHNLDRKLFQVPAAAGIAQGLRTVIGQKLLPYYARASTLAKRNQRIYRPSGLLVYSLSAIAVAIIAAGTLVPVLSRAAFSVELILLFAVLLIVGMAHWRRTHKRWIENRFLTERIRSAVFLAACGVEASPIEVPPYLGMAHQPDDWMVMTFHEVWNRLPPWKSYPVESLRALVVFIRRMWVRDQIRFHVHKAARAGKTGHRLEMGGMAIFATAMAAAALHLILTSLRHTGETAGVERLLAFVAIALPAVGAAIGGIHTHREYSRLEKRSRNMAAALSALDQRFKRVTSPEALEALLRETEELMLRETQDWLMLMRFAVLKPVA